MIEDVKLLFWINITELHMFPVNRFKELLYNEVSCLYITFIKYIRRLKFLKAIV